MKLHFSGRELSALVRLGLPIVLAQLCQTGMNCVDTIMAGRYASVDLAGVAVAGSLFAPISMFAIGLQLALPGMCAQLVGAGRPGRAAHMLRQGLFLALAQSVLLTALLVWLSWQTELLGLEGRLAEVCGGYIRALAPGIPGFLFFITMRSFFEGHGRTRPAMLIAALGLALNIPCNWIFIYGHLGLPELGGIGCGVATSICFWFMALAMALFLHLDRDLGRWSLFRGLFRPGGALGAARGERERMLDPASLAAILRVGVPMGLVLVMECVLYAVTALFLAPLGPEVVAGHQTVINYASVLFCLPVSVNMAAAIRVGRCLGADEKEAARRAAHTALVCGTALALVAMAATIACREGIAGLYSTDPRVLAHACTLLLFCAGFQLLDTVQNVSAGILRGCNDTRYIFKVMLLANGLVGIGCGWILGRTDLLVPAMGAPGFWTGYILALTLCAAAYLVRIRRLFGLPMERLRERLAR
ncbi:MAG: MATE family efflux transporter [Desulfovibrionaceae bacterium]|nr:MATE family efflux transporter [Desulfovibrionaceae bacterium]